MVREERERERERERTSILFSSGSHRCYVLVEDQLKTQKPTKEDDKQTKRRKMDDLSDGRTVLNLQAGTKKY